MEDVLLAPNGVGPSAGTVLTKKVTQIRFKVTHKEYTRFLNQFFLTPCLYHELNVIIQHMNPHSCKISICKFLFSLWSLVN